LIFGVGKGRRIPIPFPLFLLWPLIALAWLTLTLCLLFVRTGLNTRQSIVTARIALAAFGRLSGTRIDVQSKDGSGVNIRIV
jgi:hypothetical protein